MQSYQDTIVRHNRTSDWNRCLCMLRIHCSSLENNKIAWFMLFAIRGCRCCLPSTSSLFVVFSFFLSSQFQFWLLPSSHFDSEWFGADVTFKSSSYTFAITICNMHACTRIHWNCHIMQRIKLQTSTTKYIRKKWIKTCAKSNLSDWISVACGNKFFPAYAILLTWHKLDNLCAKVLRNRHTIYRICLIDANGRSEAQLLFDGLETKNPHTRTHAQIFAKWVNDGWGCEGEPKALTATVYKCQHRYNNH